MSKVDWIAEHERTTSDETVDAACFALANGLLGHTTVSEGTVEPNSAYLMLAALPYDIDRDSGMSRNHDAVNWNLDRGQVRIAAAPSTSEQFGLMGKTMRLPLRNWATDSGTLAIDRPPFVGAA